MGWCSGVTAGGSVHVTDLERRTGGRTDRPARGMGELLGEVPAPYSRGRSRGAPNALMNAPAGTSHGVRRRGSVREPGGRPPGSVPGGASRRPRGAWRRGHVPRGFQWDRAFEQGVLSATSPAYAARAPGGTWNRGWERYTGEDRTAQIGVRRPKPSGVIDSAIRERRYRGSRGGTPGSTADGPRHGSGRGDGNPSRRYRGTGGTWARGTSSATYRRTYRRTGALEGRDHPPGLPLSALPGGGLEGGERDVRVGSPVRGAPRRAGSPRKGFRKPFSPGQEPRITGINRESRESPSRADGGPGRGREAPMGELHEALGGPEGQPRALLDRRQAPRRTFLEYGKVLEGR